MAVKKVILVSTDVLLKHLCSLVYMHSYAFYRMLLLKQPHVGNRSDKYAFNEFS